MCTDSPPLIHIISGDDKEGRWNELGERYIIGLTEELYYTTKKFKCWIDDKVVDLIIQLLEDDPDK